MADEPQEDASPESAKPFTWQVTRTANGSVQITIGDDYPANDGKSRPRLTDDSYTAITHHVIGTALRELGDRLIDSSSRIAYGAEDDDWDDDDWDDD